MRKIYLLLICFAILAFVSQFKRFKQKSQEDQLVEWEQQQDQKKAKSRKNKDKRNKQISNKSRKKHTLNSNSHQEHHQYLRPHQNEFWWNALLAVFLACGGGFCSGMTVGLNSLDKLSLQVQKITGNQQQKKVASRILNTISDHHLFLVTLLIGNAMVLQWLPLVVHKIMPDWAAIITSTIAVVIVAQIVPMSATTGPNKVKLAYLGAPLVDIMVKVYYFIAYPIARGLDKLLGIHDTSKLKRRDFIQLVNYQKKNQLLPLQIIMINQLFVGAKFTSVEQIMIPINQVFIVNMNDQIDFQLIQRFSQSQLQFILVSQKKQQQYNYNVTTVLKMKQFTYSYLKLRNKNRKRTLYIKDVIHPQFPISLKDKQTAKKHQLYSRDDIHNYNSKRRIPVLYYDTGLLDALGVLDMKNSRIALIHKQRRKKQDTNMAYLDADDHVVYYDPYSQQDKHSIIGIVVLQKIMQTIVDFNGDSPIMGTLKRDQSPPKKRRLVKRASIMSAYSVQTN